jgi:NADH dehydrogenase FAD-containing subunit
VELFPSRLFRYVTTPAHILICLTINIIDIDANTKTLTCEERAVRESEHRVFKLNYDKLVVTIGADNNTYNIPGVQENTYFLKVFTSTDVS